MIVEHNRWVNFQKVKQAVSMETVLRHYQITGLRQRGDQVQGRCPIHGGERTDSFRAHLVRNVFHCFACQAKGSVLDLVAALEKCSIREAALRLTAEMGTADLRTDSAKPEPEKQLVRKEERCNPLLRFQLSGVNPAHTYLARRGIDTVTAAEFGVGFYAGPGLLHGRIVIPIANGQGQTVAYAGRSPDNALPKYKLPAGFRKASELFNLARAVATASRTVIVVEGYFDCMRVHQAGFPWVVALMGSSLSDAQQNLLWRHFDRVWLMLDGDRAGRAASQAIAPRLAAGKSVALIEVPDGAQPDQLPDRDIRRLLSAPVKPACSNSRLSE
jgi:DNA primase